MLRWLRDDCAADDRIAHCISSVHAIRRGCSAHDAHSEPFGPRTPLGPQPERRPSSSSSSSSQPRQQLFACPSFCSRTVLVRLPAAGRVERDQSTCFWECIFETAVSVVNLKDCFCGQPPPNEAEPWQRSTPACSRLRIATGGLGACILY